MAPDTVSPGLLPIIARRIGVKRAWGLQDQAGIDHTRHAADGRTLPDGLLRGDVVGAFGAIPLIPPMPPILSLRLAVGQLATA